MKTNELLFELSHTVRYEIMKALAQTPHKLTKLGELVGANNPEVSRHLDRLKKAQLVSKDPEGFYSTTPYGSIILSFLPGLSFVASYPDYFLDHDLSKLPPQFLARLGELSNCNFGEGTIGNLDVSRKITSEARERLYMISREVPSDTEVFHSKISDGVELRVLIHESALPSGPEASQRQAAAPHVLRITSSVPVIMVITESTAALMFPNRKGMFDFSAGFSSTDPAFRGWCEDLYHYLWEKGRTP